MGLFGVAIARSKKGIDVTNKTAACFLFLVMLGATAQAQDAAIPSTAPASPPAATGTQPAPGQPAGEAGQTREGAPRWQYQSEQTDPKTYTQPSYGPSIALEVEQMRNRVSSLEDRAEKLERALGEAIQVINAQTTSIEKLSGR